MCVVIAAYNGAAYIREQIASILPQLDGCARMVIIDDASTDETVSIVDSFSDSRILLLKNHRNIGVIKSFERGLAKATGNIIFLSDQDDIWLPEKVRTVLNVFVQNPRLTLVMHGAQLIDSAGNVLSEPPQCRKTFRGGIFHTLLRNRYQGCTMAFRKEILDAILPFPSGIPMHDSWIGLVNALIGETRFLDTKLIMYRRHTNNATGRVLGLGERVAHRWALIKHLAMRAPKLCIRSKRDQYEGSISAVVNSDSGGRR